jgi:hypothetical protein
MNFFFLLYCFAAMFTWLHASWEVGVDYTNEIVRRRKVLATNPAAQFPPLQILFMNLFYQGLIWFCYWTIKISQRVTLNAEQQKAN